MTSIVSPRTKHAERVDLIFVPRWLETCRNVRHCSQRKVVRSEQSVWAWHAWCVHPMLFYYWPSVKDAGPEIKQHPLIASGFVGIHTLYKEWVWSLNSHVSTIPEGRGPRVVVSTAAFHARVRGSVPGLGGLKETKMFLHHPLGARISNPLSGGQWPSSWGSPGPV